MPEEVISGEGVVRGSKAYAGQQEVPNEGYTPRTGMERYRARLDVGSQERTIPDRQGLQDEARASEPRADSPRAFSQSAAQVRSDQVGMTAKATPESSFTGKPTKSVSRWQYLTGTGDATESVSTRGSGNMYTTDPKVAAGTLERLQEAYSVASKAKDQAAMAKITEAYVNLADQLEAWRMSKVQPREEILGSAATRKKGSNVPARLARGVQATVVGGPMTKQLQETRDQLSLPPF
jgi:hypothetical protein